jgi:hypothetical protein
VLARLLILAIVSELLYGLLAALSRLPPSASPLAGFYHPSRIEETVWFLGVWAALFLAYALAIATASKRSGMGLVVFIVATSALFRATLLWSNGFSGDEPSIVLQASSPLRTILEGLPATPEGFPSLSKGLVPCLFDLGALVLGIGLLRRASLPTGLALVHGWSPLVVKEIAGSGRIQFAAALFFLLLAFRLAQRHRPHLAAISYGVALTGPLTLAATIPLLAKTLRARIALSLLLAGTAWGYLATRMPAEAIFGWPPSDGVGGSLLPALSALVHLFVVRSDLLPIALLAALWLLVAVLGTLRSRHDLSNLPREALVLVGFLLFVSPQALPWSFLPVAILAAHSANRGWVVLTATAVFPYFAMSEGRWSFWLAFAQYFPAYVSLVYTWLGRGRQRGDGA